MPTQWATRAPLGPSPRSPGIARQREALGIWAAIWACLTASNHEIIIILSCDQIYSSVKLRIRDVGSPELLGKLSLICLVCSLRISWRSDGWILGTSRLKALLAINMFDPNRACSFPGRIITLRAWASKRKQVSSASHRLVSLRVSADPWASELPLGLV